MDAVARNLLCVAYEVRLVMAEENDMRHVQSSTSRAKILQETLGKRARQRADTGVNLLPTMPPPSAQALTQDHNRDFSMTGATEILDLHRVEEIIHSSIQKAKAKLVVPTLLRFKLKLSTLHRRNMPS